MQLSTFPTLALNALAVGCGFAMIDARFRGKVVSFSLQSNPLLFRIKSRPLILVRSKDFH